MKLVLDQGLPRSTVKHLAAMGVFAQHVGELNMATSSDESILEWALQNHAVVVTLDADFHQLLAMSQSPFPSVIRIRIEGLKGDQVARIIQSVLTRARDELIKGAVVSVTRNRIRVKQLPLPR